MTRVLRLLGRWLLTAVPIVFGVSVLTFVLASLVPGDAARAVLGINASPEQHAALRRELGLDQPLWTQYWDWLTAALRGDLGTSITSGDSVTHQLGTRLEVTLSLVVGAIVVAGVVGVGLGVFSALRGGFAGRLVDVVSLLGLAIPSYWFGLVLATLFAVTWQLFPATGYVPFGESPGGWLASLVLPVLTLGLTTSAGVAKQTRDSVRGELDRDYVTVLRARGLSERSVIYKHVLRNAAPPVVTVLGLVFIGLLSGAVLVETVFVLPGLGGLAVTATAAHDIPVIQGVAVIFTLVVVAVNLLIELAYAALNPKVRS
jgi:peptide/nickel transport system permease protein